MIVEFGHVALILGFCFALALAILPLWGVFRGDDLAMRSGRYLSFAQCLFTSIAIGSLFYAFLNDDFSVDIVAAQSNSLLPSAYKFSALWGGHEGSLLLWLEVLTLWTVAVALFSRQLPLDILARVLSVMGMISLGFFGFSLFTSNPFTRHLLNTPLDGQDLNPLLQDPGMVIHPPMLYIGYVGFSVAFAFAIAALMSGRMDASWARWSRPWTNIAWLFLTVGIALGSWWAYYELGWGGWWFWDPVENASFMPWLVGTALIHSLAVTEKRGVFKSWTLLLAIFAFSLSLLGTFLVRSGVLTSVHAFAADPTRGMYILGFLVIVVGGSLTLYAFRAPANASAPSYKLLSREALLLVNNILLLVAAMTVLLGTLFPLIMDFAGLGKYSVGPPYFNAIFVPLMCLLALVLGLGPSSQWKRSNPASWLKPMLVAFVSSVILAVLLPQLFTDGWHIGAMIGVLLTAWIVLSSAVNLRNKTRNAATFYQGLRRLTPSYYGMLVAHLGFAASILGVAMVTSFNNEQDIRMEVGERVSTAFSYEVSFDAIDNIQGPNYQGQRGTFSLWQNGNVIAEMHPEKRRYHARSGQVMTEAAIDAGLMRDVFVALGEPISKDAWAVRIHVKPFIRWIWLGAILMAVGGLLAVCDKRYRPRKPSVAESKGARSAAT
ncbi:Cytochrome c-type biogenesis protein CcmF [Zhongshania aliphaticivorans]|uniref:Cytochrome c-type biogenesis protein CcmF n=1 Tax=Zhongshania aliphaticivorans TaxID=1470434 RepID=A0A5S9NDK5_9GAMM|nr:heme lyase CcmF/NrfE family subunit [Zhongshania aliphaticivorans]CAA0087802.1 Cytochrome c-type biogenesis protein CcmF [Zhongshania aliphaticivorans]CAA0115481.1 Cytochrome c-type biogenesis protein CcmF [Zhongshania aliphaticivorans]CAA0120240.1 Cytochrome c-type biogenesis protein CcmF [Zhongshania aliphaticivorans]